MRTEFTAATKRAAWDRSGGRCEHCDRNLQGRRSIAGWCGKKLFPGDIFYDHVIPDALGGDNSLKNCQVLCRAHHDPKTHTEDVPRIAKMKRQQDKDRGIRKPKSRLSNPRFKQKVSGEVVDRLTGAKVRP